MNDILAIIFFVLALCISMPLAIIATIYASRIKPKNGVYYGFAMFGVFLIVAAIIICAVGGALSYYYEDGDFYLGIYYSHQSLYRHPCVWVGMGLSIGSMVFCLLALIINAIKLHQCNRKEIPQKPVQNKTTVVRSQPQKVYKSRSNFNYIDEIKELKKLLDCGALTQSEFDMKKKQILGDVLK